MTAPSVGTTQIEVLRRMKPWQRLKAAHELYWFARTIIKQRESRRAPDLSDEALEQRVRSFFR
jgi:hypothetical protein